MVEIKEKIAIFIYKYSIFYSFEVYLFRKAFKLSLICDKKWTKA